jgi:hypothetical protein
MGDWGLEISHESNRHPSLGHQTTLLVQEMRRANSGQGEDAKSRQGRHALGVLEVNVERRIEARVVGELVSVLKEERELVLVRRCWVSVEALPRVPSSGGVGGATHGRGACSDGDVDPDVFLQLV